MVVVKLVDEEIAELRGENTDTGTGQNVFAAMPIRKPEGFHTSDVTSGFSLGVKF